MTESLRFHVEMAEAAQSPTEFRMLNGAITFPEASFTFTTFVFGLMQNFEILSSDRCALFTEHFSTKFSDLNETQLRLHSHPCG